MLYRTVLYFVLQGRTGNVQEMLERGRSGGTMKNSYAGERIDAGRTFLGSSPKVTSTSVSIGTCGRSSCVCSTGLGEACTRVKPTVIRRNLPCLAF